MNNPNNNENICNSASAEYTGALTMTSLQIAEITGKRHRDLMRAIRKMEDAWFNVCGRKFALTSQEVRQPNGGTRQEPCYQLTKTECLYIATKFNDEARAKLVLRWHELEEATPKLTENNYLEALCRSQRKNIKMHEHIDRLNALVSRRGELVDAAINLLPALVTTTDMAGRFGMSAQQLNKQLEAAGVIMRSFDGIYLTPPYRDWGIAVDHQYDNHDGETNNYLKWTDIGQVFLLLLFAYSFKPQHVCKVFENGSAFVKTPAKR